MSMYQIQGLPFTENMATSIWQAILLKKKYEDNLLNINFAIKEGKIEVLDKLLSELHDLQININNPKDAALFYVACISGNVNLLKKFEYQKFPVNSPLKTIPQKLLALQNYLGFTGLHFAFKYHRLDAVHFLLRQGASMFISDDKGITPLHVLFESKKQMLKKHKSCETYNKVINLILQNSQDCNEMSHFHISCTRDVPETIQDFLHSGNCVNQTVGTFPGHKEFSPLHLAAKYNCCKVAEFLLENGADVSLMDQNGRTALHLTDSPVLAQLLLQYGADFMLQDSDGNTSLHRAFEKRNFEIIDLLLSAHININANPANTIGISHFQIACTRNNENIVRHFLENDVPINGCVPTDPNIEYTYYWDDLDWRGCSPLHFAVAFNTSKIVELLLSLNADVKTQDARGFTALHLACRSMHEKIGELIMNSLPDYSSPEIKWINWSSNRKNQIDIIKMLLEYKSDVNCHDNFNNTPVFSAYVYYALDDPTFLEKYQTPVRNNFLREMLGRRKLMLKLLLQHPVDLDTCHDNGSILHYMMKEAQVSKSYSGPDELVVLEMFLKKGLNVDDLNGIMLTPLYVAVLKTNRMDFILSLMEHGASVNYHEPKRHSTILHIADKNYGIISYNLVFKTALRKGADPNARQLDGTTMLHNLACSLRSPQDSEIFKSLIEAGADVDAYDAKGRTPLFNACFHSNEEFTKVLLHYGADVNIEDNDGRTALCFMYEEKLLKKRWNKRSTESNEVYNTVMVILKHVTKKRKSVSEKVLSSRGKIMEHLQFEEPDVN